MRTRQDIVGIVIGVILIIVAGFWIRQGEDRRTMLNVASRVGFELKGLDKAKRQFAQDKNRRPTDLVRFSDLVPYLENDQSGASITIHALAKRNGLDEAGNPILIGTNEMAVGGPISDPIHVNPKTKEMLTPVTHGDMFWGDYR